MTNVEIIAKVVHEANRAWCESNGDFSQPSWENAPDWQKNSAYDGVRLHIANPDLTPEQSHDNWSEYKIKEGWVYGPVKDPNANPPTHPCLVPYNELPHEQRVKDSLFKSIIHAITNTN